MRTLREIYDAMGDEAEELQAEGISFHDYWLARMDIDRRDWNRWHREVIQTVVSDEEWEELPAEVKMRMFISHGFFVGLLYGREKSEYEFESD